MCEGPFTQQIATDSPRSQEVKELEPRPTILLSGTVLLEITQKCYTLCGHCYQKDWVTPKGHAIPLEVIAKRIDWIKQFTDTKEVGLLGGEPLLHPQFRQIVELLIEKGFKVSIITSGKISNLPIEQENLQYALQLYEADLLEINLSYQPSKNEDAFYEFYQQFEEATKRKRQKLKERAMDEIRGVCGEIFHDRFKFLRIVNLATIDAEGSNPRKRRLWRKKINDLTSKLRREMFTDFDNQSAKELVEVLEKVATYSPKIQNLIKTLKQLLSTDLFTTVTLDQTVASDKQLFDKIMEFILEKCHGYKIEEATCTDDAGNKRTAKEKMEWMFEMLQKHFAPFEQSELFNRSLYFTKNDILHTVRIWGQDRVIPASLDLADVELITAQRRVERARGTAKVYQICSAMGARIDDQAQTVNLGGLNIRADGEVTFPVPACISVRTGMCNVDIHQSVDAIYDASAEHLRELQTINIEAKAQRATADIDRCHMDPLYPQTEEAKEKLCPSCQCDIACNACHEIHKPRVAK